MLVLSDEWQATGFLQTLLHLRIQCTAPLVQMMSMFCECEYDHCIHAIRAENWETPPLTSRFDVLFIFLCYFVVSILSESVSCVEVLSTA